MRPSETSVLRKTSSTGRPDPSGEAALEAPSDPGHRVREDEVDDRDEKVELERPDLAVIDDLRRLGEVHVADDRALRSEEHTSELQSLAYLVCRLLLEKKKKT